MSDSIWDDPNVTAFILGELSTEEAEAFEDRIREDSSLAEVVAEARSVTNQLQIMYTEDASTTLDPKRRDAITEGNQTNTLAATRKVKWRIQLTLLATAAALLLLLGSPYLFETAHTVSNESADPFSPESRDSEGFSGSINAVESLVIDSSRDQPSGAVPATGMSHLNEMKSIELETLDEFGDGLQMDGEMDQDDVAGFGMGATAPRNVAQKKVAGDAATPFAEAPKSKTRFEQRAVEDVGLAKAAGPAAAPTAPARASTRARRRLADKTEIPGKADSLLIPDLPFIEDNPGDQNRFDNVTENAFKRVSDAPLSTFSVDVDTASYSKVREYLLKQRRLPPVDAVRTEELVNYFNYEYLPPKDDAEHPFAAKAEIIACPWNDDHRLARIALKGKTMKPKNRPLSNLVFLLDTSGSMNSPNKLPLVKAGMNMLLSQLGENDRVAIVVYAGSAGLALDSTPATKTRKIEKALNTLAAGGSTNGGQGIQLAYQTARDNFIDGGVNRVILCTDGDFNVGTTGTGSLVRMVEQEAAGNIFLSVLGFGMGNHNDSMLEQISGKGNGNYAFIDSQKEAQKVLVDQVSGTLVTIAKDVKLQIEFNPRMVSAYRLIGYENRVLAKEDFNNDKKDAGEIGAGHAVTALYELIPAGVQRNSVPPKVDNLKYQSPNKLTDAANGAESLTLKLRYKQPDGDTSQLVEFPVIDNETTFQDADHDARFAAAVASFGMQLRQSEYSGHWNMQNVIDVANDAKGEDMSGLRTEFVEMAEAAKRMKQ
jgi:Ca-activated chloride channel family protein